MTSSVGPPPPGTELLDDPDAAPALVELSLHNLARSNRWFGGAWAVGAGLRTLLRDYPHRTLRLLDVGAGGGDLAAYAVRWAARRGLAVEPIGLERHQAAAQVGARGGLMMAHGSGLAMPFRDQSFDLVLMSQVLHHLSDLEIQHILEESARVARWGILAADLVRSRTAQWAFRLAGRALRFDPWTITDGCISLQRGFTRERIAALWCHAGLGAPTVRTVPFARIVATWRRPT